MAMSLGKKEGSPSTWLGEMPILILRKGTQRSKGKEAQISNIEFHEKEKLQIIFA